jgi:hypothetical protein
MAVIVVSHDHTGQHGQREDKGLCKHWWLNWNNDTNGFCTSFYLYRLNWSGLGSATHSHLDV